MSVQESFDFQVDEHTRFQRRAFAHDYGHEVTPEVVAHQIDFFTPAFIEAKDSEFEGRRIKGPAFDDFTSVLSVIDELLKEVDPNLTGAHLVPNSYITPEARAYLRTKKGWYFESALDELYSSKIQWLRELGAKYAKEWSAQEIPAELLDTPPYCRQGDGTWSADRRQTCFNACFRMVFGGVTGDIPNEGVILDGLRSSSGREYGNLHLADDEHFMKIFNTNSFKQKYAKPVELMSFTGMDLNNVAKIAELIKARYSGVQVFCIVSLDSEQAHGIWHTNVLLKADENTVTCHDPSADHGNGSRKLRKAAFLERWAVALNRGHLVIAYPEESSTANELDQ